MRVPRSTARVLGIAIMAIAGMLSMAGEVSACTEQATRACCVVLPSGHCVCCGMRSVAGPVDARLAAGGPTLVDLPAHGCGCRADHPAEPVDPAPRTPSERRSDPGPGNLPLVVGPAWSAAWRARLAEPARDLGGVPLYLRYAHFLI